MDNLELRMYGLVPFNISPIQQGIQFGHAVVEYGQMYKDDLYNEWADNYKTFIILNGGTTNKKISKDKVPFGTLNQHLLTLKENDIKVSTFEEPDLGDQLTAITFIVDERVFNKTDYPDYEDWLDDKYPGRRKNRSITHLDEYYEEWLGLIGSDKNLFLRQFLSQFNLA